MFDSIEIYVFIVTISLIAAPQALAGGKLPVFATIAPQKHFVQQIGKMDRGTKKLAMPAHHRHEGKVEQNIEGEHILRKPDLPTEKITMIMGGLDPHTWLSPPPVKIQACTILGALQEIDPAHRSIYESNFRNFDSQEVVFVDPMAENWSANLREVASRFKKALR